MKEGEREGLARVLGREEDAGAAVLTSTLLGLASRAGAQKVGACVCM